MTKVDLVNALVRKAGVTEEVAEQVVDQVLASMVDSLVRGGRIEIRGFGSLRVKTYGAYTGRNPKTGLEISVAPKRLPVFKISGVLHDELNEGLA